MIHQFGEKIRLGGALFDFSGVVLVKRLGESEWRRDNENNQTQECDDTLGFALFDKDGFRMGHEGKLTGESGKCTHDSLLRLQVIKIYKQYFVIWRVGVINSVSPSGCNLLNCSGKVKRIFCFA